MRILWAGLGWVAVALALAGIPLPLLPTTPFLLLAAFCFARSSPRLHAWLLDHKTFGPVIRKWRDHGAIPRRAKVLAVSMMAATFAASALLGAPGFVLVIQAVVMTSVSIFLITRPEGASA